MVFEVRQVSHALVMGTAGAADTRWMCRGTERVYHHSIDETAFFACDDEDHTRVIRAAPVYSTAIALQIPRLHLKEMGDADEVGLPGECRSFLPRPDAELRYCLNLLCTIYGREEMQDIGSEIVARRLVSRLLEILGGRGPDWREDTSVFSTRETKRIVEYIDSRLHVRHHFCLEEISSLVGLTPSHCAKKFRNTIESSLGRFINRRRVARAMLVLCKDEISLAELALDLGLSSQSHLTRLFSELTGMTPARYRKRFKPTVG